MGNWRVLEKSLALMAGTGQTAGRIQELGGVFRLRRRLQIMLLVVTMLVLTGIIVTGALALMQRPSELTMAVGPEGSPERGFAEKLAELLLEKHASVRLKLVGQEGGDSALTRFSRNNADLAILRTDARLPSHARAVAILEHELLLIIGPHKAELEGIEGLRGKKLAVLGDSGRNENLIRQILEVYDVNASATPLRTVPTNTPLEKLLARGNYDFVLAFEPVSQIAASRDFDQLAAHMGGFSLFGLKEADAMERKLPGLFSETIQAGLLSGAPSIPEQDTATVGVERILMARDDVREHDIAEVMRVMFGSKTELQIDHRFALHIEPPDTDKDSLIAAHEGAAEFVDSDVKGFFDRYSDIIYLVMSVGSVIGSLGLAGFTAATRVKPAKAGERAHDVMALLEKIRETADCHELDIVETELEDILRDVLRGLKDGTVSAEGLDAFRMGYEHAREALVSRRRIFPTNSP
jgi:TRAP-type uncharacterized transport system substrate-binding protein